MKNKKLTKKLNFNKTTVANLNHMEMKKLRGGTSFINQTCDDCFKPSEEQSSCPGCLFPCETQGTTLQA